MEPRDVYKLLYQGVMGAEHLLTSPKDFVQRLVSEFNHAAPDPAGRLLEPVRTDQSLMRLNLRVYKSQHQQVDALVPSFLESARFSLGSLAELQAAWLGFIQSCQQGSIINFDLANIQRFTRWLEKTGYQPLHHSDAYRQQYQPAYRLISASSLKQFGF